MFEKHHQPVLAFSVFLRRFIHSLLLGSAVILISLFGGMYGYHYYEGMNWVDAYVNAAMILSGMGPVDVLKTEGGKVFAGSYALFSGIVFLIVIAIIFAPIIHRFFHHFLVKDK